MKKQIRKLKRKILRLALLDAKRAGFNTLDFLQLQIRIRPRIRMAAKVLALLIVTFAVSSRLSSYIKVGGSEVIIFDQMIVVAQEAEVPKLIQETSQAVIARRLDFDFKKPVDGHVSQRYSSYHRAQDIAASFASPVHPIGQGKIEFAGFVRDGKGNVVIIDHGDGLKSLYAHLGKIYAGVGNVVDSDSTIGTVGLTGYTTGPHVHLEVYDQEIAVNPAALLP